MRIKFVSFVCPKITVRTCFPDFLQIIDALDKKYTCPYSYYGTRLKCPERRFPYHESAHCNLFFHIALVQYLSYSCEGLRGEELDNKEYQKKKVNPFPFNFSREEKY